MSNVNIVLVLDASQRSALAVTRSIGSIADSYVITTDCFSSSLAGASRFSNQYLQCPSPMLEPLVFINWLEKTIERYSVDLLLPMTEVTSQLILINRSKFSRVELPFPRYEQVLQIADKSNLTKQAEKLGIPAPKSLFFNNASEINIDTLDFPCVLKPALSYLYKENQWTATQVRILNSKSDLRIVLNTDEYLSDSRFMIQEYITGHGAGLFCFYDQGNPKAFFAHKRIREKPPSGGVSVLSESIAVDETLKKYAIDLLASVKWHGVAMVEFRMDLNGKAYLMEVNTRFWGSLQLAIDSGVDFPRWVYTTQLSLAMKEANSYKIGQRLRWILGDIDGLYIYLKSNEPAYWDKVKRIISFFLSNPVGCKHETNRLYDFKPALSEFKTYFADLMNLK